MADLVTDIADVDLEQLSQEERLRLAIIAIEKTGISERQAAKYYGVPRTTLQGRRWVIPTRVKGHAHEHSLGAPKESVLKYNMDEQGIQLGVGDKSVVFDPAEASISILPNGWTYQELGALWLEKDFAPPTDDKLDDPADHRLLILDGHGTFRFLDFAQA